LKEQCGLCKRVLSTSRLRKCERCGRLYCRDCMIEDIITGDRLKLVCLNCARRSVVPKSSLDKFGGLSRYLRFRGGFTDLVKLNFVRIDGLIGENLPQAAFREEDWWSNSEGNVHARGWLDAGFEVSEANLKEGYVVFHRVREVPVRKSLYHKIEKPFTPVPVRRLRSKVPSKTKVSKLYARVKNVERRRRTLPSYRGLGGNVRIRHLADPNEK
jgi:hypothetical protein